jgi:hypothetical protein
VVDSANQITHIQGQPFDSSKVYSVALPRNLLNGFCAITPLTQFGESMEQPEADNFLPAFHLVMSYYSKMIWKRMGAFDSIDTDHDGQITRKELEEAYLLRTGTPPSPNLIDSMMAALDEDHDGTISEKEYCALG